MQIIDMRVRVPRKFADHNPEPFMEYYQDRLGLIYVTRLEVMS